MAYYDDGYMWPQEHTAYDLVSYQDSVSFSGYESYNDLNSYGTYTVSEFHEPNFIENYHCTDDYNYAYDYGYGYDHDLYPPPNTEIKYLEYSYVEPKLIAYEPVACDTGYISYHTEYSISYSQVDSGFNEPEFEEYDPTPYDGGYDIVTVYGKPLPPSDQTCYPRSKPKPIEPKPRPNPEPKPISIPTPIPLVVSKPEPKLEPRSNPGPESTHVPVLLPPPKVLPTPIPVVEPEPKPKLEPEPVSVVPMHQPLGSIEVEETQKEDYNYPNYGYDYPWPEYDNGYGIGVGYDYGYGKQMVQVPPIEYDSQVVDLCENLFGSWPCLARIRKQQMAINNNSEITCPPKRQHNPLEDCANYIFGSPITSCNP